MNKEKIENTGELIEEWDWDKAVPTGRPVERRLAHKTGIAHEGVHLWIIRTMPQMELLFQHRAKDKEMYPDCLDITVGGHVPFGVADKKIQKESYEEVGISPSDNELIDLGCYRYEEKAAGLFHREFQSVYILIDNRPLDGYRFIDGEVDAIFAVRLDELKALLVTDTVINAECFENNRLGRKEISRKDFHPLLFTDPMKVYMRVLIRAAEEIALKKTVNAKMPAPY